MVVLCPTRHALPDQLNALLRAALRGEFAIDAGIYCKTDSTLRGPIGAVFAELLRQYPGRNIAYWPAYPAMGRTVKGGVLYVNGVPVAETEFALDRLNPVRSSRIRDVLEAGFNSPILEARDSRELRALLHTERTGRLFICDGSVEEDMAGLAEVCREDPSVICAGPAGGIRHWVPARTDVPLRTWPPVSEWMIICGSRHPISREQTRRASALGFRTYATPEEDSMDADRELTCIPYPQGIILFGGDTALKVWRALGVNRLNPVGEILPGIAVSIAGGRVFVTKAGGFGGPDVVAEMMEGWNQ